MPTLGERLKELRTSNKMTQRQIAAELGITERTYQYYEVDRTCPPLATITELADLYSVSVDYLLARTEKREMNI